ncbi:MAG: FecR domain-containing protein [Magnetococcales bacterium]|nr:FecR domain-containing protein [Magnetococcales bacterium]
MRSHPFTLLLILVFSLAPLSAWAEAAFIAKVIALRGEVTAEKNSGESRFLEKGSKIFSGDIIVTQKSQVQLRFIDKMMLTLYKNTRFSIDDYQFSDQESNKDRSHFNLLHGAIHTLTGRIGKKFNENYSVKTKMALLGVRGTNYYAVMDQDLQVNVVQGKVVLTNQGGTLLVEESQTALVSDSNLKPSLTGGPFNMDRLHLPPHREGEQDHEANQGNDATTAHSDPDSTAQSEHHHSGTTKSASVPHPSSYSSGMPGGINIGTDPGAVPPPKLPPPELPPPGGLPPPPPGAPPPGGGGGAPPPPP